MKTERIYTQNAAYQRFEVLRTNRNKRYRYGEFLVEGVRNINQAVKNRWQIASFLYTRERPLSGWAEELLATVATERNFELTASLMAGLSGKVETSELLAVVKMRREDPQTLQLPENPLLALFDRPSNRGNLGTILRSCDGLGVDALFVTGHGVDLYDPEVVVSSMGSFFNVPTLRIEDNQGLLDYLSQLRERYPGFQVIGTTAHREHPVYDADLTTPLLLLIGNETDGLCRAFKECSDLLVTIPMAESSSASSFNVGCAATVLFYEAARQRNGRR